MSISLNYFSQFPNLTFWSRLHVTGGGQSPIKLEIIEKTNETFKSTSSQIQSENNNSGGFIEDPKILEELGFFKALAFLDDLEEEKPVIEYAKQDDAVINDRKQLIANSRENKQNIDSSTKKTSPIRRSKRIAERNLNIESSSNSKELPSSKKKDVVYHLRYRL